MKALSFHFAIRARMLGLLGLTLVLAWGGDGGGGAASAEPAEPLGNGDEWNVPASDDSPVDETPVDESQAEEGQTGGLGAAEPGPFPDDPSVRYLLLDNDKVMVGTVEPAEGGYALIRNGGRIFFEETRVRFIAGSLAEVYRFKTEQVPAHDISEHMKIHYWCLANRLEAEALDELRGILAVDPKHDGAARRLAHLESKRSPSRPKRAGGEEGARAARPIAPPEKIVANFIRGHGPQAFEQYNQVERVLLNKCSAGACHGSARHGGGFRLYGIQSGRIRDQRLTARNLQSVQDFIEWKNPERSPILYMALEPHGRLEVAPLGGVNDPMYKELRDWVYAVVDGWSVDASVLATSRTSAPSADDEARADFGSARTKAVTGPIQRFQRPERPITLPGSVVESIDESFAPAADDAPPGTVEGKVLHRAPRARPVGPAAPSAPSAPGAPSAPAATSPVPPDSATAPKVVPNAADPFDPASFNQVPDEPSTPAPASTAVTRPAGPTAAPAPAPEETRLAPLRQTIAPESKSKFFKAPSLPFGLGKKKAN